MSTEKWDGKAAKTNLFAQELKDEAGTLERLEAELRARIADLLGTLQAEIAEIPKPTRTAPQPELLPTTEPFEARELRRIERRDWKRLERVNDAQWRSYWAKVDPIRNRFVRANHFLLTVLASQYLWVKDVRSKPLPKICNTAFYGIVGYWLRAREKIDKRGYLFNSDAEERVVKRELADRMGEWQPEGCRVLPEGRW
jgi:uncharacterized protein YqcC (DUF446 family)